MFACIHLSSHPSMWPWVLVCVCVWVLSDVNITTFAIYVRCGLSSFRICQFICPPVCPSVCLSLDQSLSMSIPRRFFYDVHVLVIDNGNYHSYLMWHCSFVGHYFFLSSSSVFERGVPPRASYAPQVLASSAIIVSLVKTFLHCSFLFLRLISEIMRFYDYGLLCCSIVSIRRHFPISIKLEGNCWKNIRHS